MESRRNTRSRQAACHCTKSGLPSSSSLLFLSIILPASSFAQLGIRQDVPPAISNPATLITSTTPSASSLNPLSTSSSSSPTNTPPPTGVAINPPPATSSNTIIPTTNEHVFNYYFLIIALLAVIACLCILYIGRRKKRKQAILRSNSQRALARDVEGFRSRFNRGPTRGNPWAFGGFGLGGHNAGNTEERVEGLDERGEAPPPYVPGSKPPSLRSVDVHNPPAAGLIRSDERNDSSGEAVELGRISGNGRETRGTHPPEYHTAVSSEDIADVTRPPTAVTASERFGSMRRLISGTGSTTHS